MSSTVSSSRASIRLRLTALFGVIGVMHLVGWGVVILILAPEYPAMLGLGFLAYTLGLRHAFDADHIAAIDNTTRKLLQEGKKHVGVGFFFSLGHSTIVVLAALLLALATRTAQDQFPVFQEVGGVIGLTVSGVFLYLIGILNLIILIDIIRIFREMKAGRYDEERLEEQLASRGFMNRFAGRLFNLIRSSWQMYPLGIVFGLGFDTASQVGLLAISAGAGSGAIPVWGIMMLPLLFASGMSLMDTADGAFMVTAYGWAFSKPIRKVYYNITVTGLSVAVALVVGTTELAQVSIQTFGLDGGVWSFIGGLDFGLLGYIIVGMLVATWAISILIWRYGRVEERWSVALADKSDEEFRERESNR